MWLKIFGSTLVVIAGTLIGFQMAARCSERPRQIRQIIGCLASLKSYINYVAMPLPDALDRCVTGTEGPVAELFTNVADILQCNGWMTPQEAIDQALVQAKGKLVLCKPETEILAALGANLGYVSREEQEKYLDMVQQQLAQIESDAIKIRDQNTKMYRYLGVCGSLAVIILLL